MDDEAANNIMVEGRDYLVEADGRWVFSRSYLLGRGKCCGSKCQNCPYGLSPKVAGGEIENPAGRG